MKKIIFTVFSILIILTTIFFIAIGTVRDSRYYILILVYIIVYKIILSFTKYSLQGTTQGRYLTGGVPPVRFSM